MDSTQYDAIVIGTGQGGGPLASALARAGLRTAIVERSDVGGSCINVGCTPTKTMVASARVAYLARRGAEYGVRTAPVSVDLEVVRQRKREIVESFRSGSERGLTETDGLDLVRGEASFVGAHDVDVRLEGGAVRRLSAPKIFINTGARSIMPPIPGIDRVPTLDNASIMELGTVPEHLVVLGGGYIGLEFGQMFRRFGSAVTIVHRGRQLLAREDADIAEEVAKILIEDGIEVQLEAEATAVAEEEGRIRLTFRREGQESIIEGSHLLVAVGRAPDTRALKVEAAGIKLDRAGFIEVNDRLETNVPGIYALGDVKPGPAFTHISYDDFRILRTNLIEHGNASIKDRLVPYTVFIDPQLGRVGMSESEARRAGRKIRVAKMPMAWVARALEMDEPRGLMKAIVDAETDQILGAAILGVEGGEVMSAVQLAMMGKLPYTALKNGVFAHPTLAEALNNLFGNFQD